MSERIDKFCEDLRVKLTGIEANADGLKKRVVTSIDEAKAEASKRHDAVAAQLAATSAKVEASKAAMLKWAKDRKATTAAAVAGWKADADVAKLNLLADAAEAYAISAIDVANASIDEAELAALDAWIARADANAAKK